LAESVDDEQRVSKRKSHQNGHGPLKKVKYDDITSKTSNKSKNELYKPPTVEELNELKETQNLYNNNLFRLQIEELIKEVKIKNKHRNAFKTWYQSFQSLLDELPDFNIPLSGIKKKAKKKLSDTDRLVNDIADITIKCDQDFILRFVKPEMNELFGLDNINAWPGPKLRVNINLKMPRAYFNVKDYLNNRYFVKRHYYLAYICHFLKEKNSEGEVQWSFHNNNSLLPILQVNLNEKITVNIFATPVENYFKPSRFLPDVNNVKINTFDSSPTSQAPTPFYNASLVHDVTLTANNLFIRENLSELSNAQEAIKLIYVWLAQRELNAGLGSFTEDLIVYFVAYLYAKKRINKHMSSYQILRNFWNFLSETDLTKSPISLGDDSKSLESFQENYDVVFLDITGCYNVTAFLNSGVYKKIKSECGIAFKLLDDGGINAFHSLFITKLPVELQYDLVLTLKSDSRFDNIADKMSEDERTKFLGLSELFVVKHVEDVLNRGFNKRASLIVPIVGQNEFNKMSFGINLDPSNAFGIIEMGPALNDPKEKEFREFWGELSTDRRYRGFLRLKKHIFLRRKRILDSRTVRYAWPFISKPRPSKKNAKLSKKS
jgi:U3 small nucleolar RNA-associated protein 22